MTEASTPHAIFPLLKRVGEKTFIVCRECDEVILPKVVKNRAGDGPGWVHLSERTNNA